MAKESEEEPLWDDEPAAHEPPFDDPFVRRFVQTTMHLRRYLPFYAGALAWVLVMLFVQPIGGGDGGIGSSPLASGGVGRQQARPAGATRPAAASASVASAFGGGDQPFAIGASTVAGDSFGSSGGFDDGDSSFTAGGDFDSSTSFDDSSSDLDLDEPEPLRIVASGYASATAGTPLEALSNPSATGLPVASEGGNDTKRSFLRLRGDESVLRLKLVADPGANRLEPAASVKACAIKASSASWEPVRAQPMAAAPAFDCTVSVAGSRGANGEWTFDLHPILGDALAHGVALVPGGVGMFQVTFAPSAVTAAA